MNNKIVKPEYYALTTYSAIFKGGQFGFCF